MEDQTRPEAVQARGAGGLEEVAALNLHRTSDRIARAEAELLARHDLTPVQYSVLRILRGAGAAGLQAGEIGARMLTRTPDATRLVDRLERQGRVRRERPRQDRRVVRVQITEAGRRTLAELDLPLSALHRRLLGHLGARRLAELIQLLDDAGSAR